MSVVTISSWLMTTLLIIITIILTVVIIDHHRSYRYHYHHQWNPRPLSCSSLSLVVARCHSQKWREVEQEAMLLFSGNQILYCRNHQTLLLLDTKGTYSFHFWKTGTKGALSLTLTASHTHMAQSFLPLTLSVLRYGKHLLHYLCSTSATTVSPTITSLFSNVSFCALSNFF